MLREINKILFNYDLENLIYDESQTDEYIVEAKMILDDIIGKEYTVKTLANIINKVFKKQFGYDQDIYDTEILFSVAEDILELVD